MSAIRHLKRVDPVLGRIIERVGPCRFAPRAEGTHFDAVLRSIIYQQLSGKAAGTILSRVLALYGGRSPTPAELLATPDEPLRAAGVSRQKIGYLRDLAGRAASGEVPFERLHELDDAGIIAALSRVKGVGRWTAQMFLMFRLGRPDVLPELDLGVQNAIRRAYGLPARPTPAQVLEIGARWSPHATIASWYLWRSLELPDAIGEDARVGAGGAGGEKAKGGSGRDGKGSGGATKGGMTKSGKAKSGTREGGKEGAAKRGAVKRVARSARKNAAKNAGAKSAIAKSATNSAAKPARAKSSATKRRSPARNSKGRG